MPDEPSPGELARRIEAVNGDLKDDWRAVERRLDGKVSADVFKLEQAAQDRAVQALADRVTAIETARAREERQRQDEAQARAAQRASDRRLIFSALVVPILIVLLQTWLAARGAGS